MLLRLPFYFQARRRNARWPCAFWCCRSVCLGPQSPRSCRHLWAPLTNWGTLKLGDLNCHTFTTYRVQPLPRRPPTNQSRPQILLLHPWRFRHPRSNHPPLRRWSKIKAYEWLQSRAYVKAVQELQVWDGVEDQVAVVFCLGDWTVKDVQGLQVGQLV